MSDWDEIRMILREVAKRQKEREEWGKKIDERIEKLLKDQEKTDEQIKRTDEQIKRTDEQIKRTDEQIRRTDRELRKMFEQTDKEIKELRESIKEVSKLVKEVSDNVGGLNASFGKIAEALSLPEVEDRFKEFNIDIFEIHPDVKIKYNGGKKAKEVDAILVANYNNESIVIVIETQVRFKNIKEVNEFLRFLSNFKKLFPEYKDYKVAGCIAGLRFGQGVDKYAIKARLFVLKPIKGVMGIINSPKFVPKFY